MLRKRHKQRHVLDDSDLSGDDDELDSVPLNKLNEYRKGGTAIASGGVKKKKLRKLSKRVEEEEEDESQNEEEFVVEKIKDVRVRPGRYYLEYRIKWEGYESCDDTWEPEAHLEHAPKALVLFREQNAEKIAGLQTQIHSAELDLLNRKRNRVGVLYDTNVNSDPPSSPHDNSSLPPIPVTAPPVVKQSPSTKTSSVDAITHVDDREQVRSFWLFQFFDF
jgi:hypothetical protein